MPTSLSKVGMFGVALLLANACMADVQYWQVKPSDRLWQIATQLNNSKAVTTQQMMVALFKLNHTLFLKDNINGLQKNVQLRIPTLRQARQVSDIQALRLIREQNRQWKGFGSKSKASSRYKGTATFETMVKRLLHSEDGFVNQLKTQVAELLVQQQHNTLILNKQSVQVEAVHHRVAQTQQQLEKIQEMTSSQMTKVHTLEDNWRSQLEMQKQHGHQLAKKLMVIQPRMTQLQDKVAQLHQVILYGGGGAIGFLLLLLLMLWVKTRRMKASLETVPVAMNSVETPQVASPDDDYDYLGSNEGVGAKLDLARAYIEMGDYSAARDALQEVLHSPKSDLAEQAAQLLEQIKEK